jgi:hypothetical protein
LFCTWSDAFSNAHLSGGGAKAVEIHPQPVKVGLELVHILGLVLKKEN